jgi:hypothetical protein
LHSILVWADVGAAALLVVVVAEDADRVGGRLGAALHAQLGEQRGHVILHGLLGQEHPLADLPVGQSFPISSRILRQDSTPATRGAAPGAGQLRKAKRGAGY